MDNIEELVEDLIYASYNFHKGVEFKSKASERIRTLLQSVKHEFRQQSETKIQGELNNIIKILYTSEKIQLTHSEVLRLANRLEAIEKLLQSHKLSVTREEIYELLRELDERYGINCVNSVTFEIGELLKSKGIPVKGEK